MKLALHASSACLVYFYKGQRGWKSGGWGWMSSKKIFRLAIVRLPPLHYRFTFYPVSNGLIQQEFRCNTSISVKVRSANRTVWKKMLSWVATLGGLPTSSWVKDFNEIRNNETKQKTFVLQKNVYWQSALGWITWNRNRKSCRRAALEQCKHKTYFLPRKYIPTYEITGGFGQPQWGRPVSEPTSRIDESANVGGL